MEHRNDLANILLSGLPDDERQHVITVINQTDQEKLRRKRASGAAMATIGPDADDDPEADYDDREAAY